jgi:hypothetical protein
VINGKSCGGRCKLPGPSAGGVAYVGVWGVDQTISPYFRPAFTFNGRGSAQLAATTASHEAGHNMGLGHDGVSQSGNGISGNTGYLSSLTGQDGTTWGATMGAAFGADVTQWSNGDYDFSTNAQDDLAILGARLNFISDTEASVPSSADNAWPGLRFDGRSYPVSGVIKTPGARGAHVYQFTSPAVMTGTLVANTQFSDGDRGRSITLVFRVTVVGSNGNVVCDRTVSGNTNPVVSCALVAVPAGTYTVTIQGGQSAIMRTGSNVPLFSEYGNLGSYEVRLPSFRRPPHLSSMVVLGGIAWHARSLPCPRRCTRWVSPGRPPECCSHQRWRQPLRRRRRGQRRCQPPHHLSRATPQASRAATRISTASRMQTIAGSHGCASQTTARTR